MATTLSHGEPSLGDQPSLWASARASDSTRWRSTPRENVLPDNPSARRGRLASCPTTSSLPLKEKVLRGTESGILPGIGGTHAGLEKTMFSPTVKNMDEQLMVGVLTMHRGWTGSELLLQTKH